MISFRRLFVIANLLLFSLSTEVQSQDEDVFQATKDWQDIREGQKIPSGLHYRMNLETGKKEAKLLSEEDSGQGNFDSFSASKFGFKKCFVILG